MEIHPRLLAEVRFEGLSDITQGRNVFAWPGVRLLVVRNGPEVSVYDLDDILAGRIESRLRVSAPELAASGMVAAGPNADFLVHCGRREIRAFDRDGTVRWRYPHLCWGCMDETDHTDRYTCDDSYSGSAHVSADGRVVFAHTPSPFDEETEGGEQWVVLDAADGGVVAARALASLAAAGSGHHLSANGRNLALDIGYGQDGASVFLGEWDGAQWTVSESEAGDRVGVDVAADGRSWLSTPHGSDDELVVHEIPGGRRVMDLRSADLPFPTRPEHSGWDYPAVFLDLDTIVATVHRADRDSTEHWLIDVAAGPVGPIVYDVLHSGVVCLGDGRWATCGHAEGRAQSVLRIWER